MPVQYNGFAQVPAVFKKLLLPAAIVFNAVMASSTVSEKIETALCVEAGLPKKSTQH